MGEEQRDEFILINDIPSAHFHDGGRIRFGPDGLLYVTTEDATVPSSSQDINSLVGQISRMNKNSSIPKIILLIITFILMVIEIFKV